jgi:DNA-binding SARP family transcriptional activator
MKAFAASGNVAEAIWVYEALCCRLRDDLGIVPSPETRELHRGLLA